MLYSNVKNLKWADANNTILNCTVNFDSIGNNIPFTTSINSDTDYGQEIFQNALNGDYGTIQPYNRDINKEWDMVRFKRNKLLTDSDYTQLPDIQAKLTTQKKTEWLNYRQALRDITTTYNDPKDVIWPVLPSN